MIINLILSLLVGLLLIAGIWLTGMLGIISVEIWIDLIYNFDILILLLAVLMTLIFILTVIVELYYIITFIRRKLATREIELVHVKIVGKEHKPSRTTLVPTGKTIVPIITPSTNEIKILYKQYKYTITATIGEININEIEIGDIIEMNKITYINKKNEIIETEFRFI